MRYSHYYNILIVPNNPAKAAKEKYNDRVKDADTFDITSDEQYILSFEGCKLYEIFNKTFQINIKEFGEVRLEADKISQALQITEQCIGETKDKEEKIALCKVKEALQCALRKGAFCDFAGKPDI